MNKTAVITGGSRGIGFAIARKLAMEGCNIVVFATGPLNKYKDKIDEEFNKKNVPFLYVQGSLSDKDDREKLLRETLERFGRIDILVNNAGVAPLLRKDLLEMSGESYERVMSINAEGTFFLTQQVAKRMILQEKIFPTKGHIVNVGSCSAEVSSVSRGEYCISKAAVSMITKLFADRLAGDDIIVNEIRPGVIHTDMVSAVEEKYNRLISEGIFPIARWGEPEDVAEMVAFFCSDSVRYTTGNYVDVDGGFHIRRL